MSKKAALFLSMIAMIALTAGCKSMTVTPNYTAAGAPVNYSIVGDAEGTSEGTVVLGLITFGVESNYCTLPQSGIGLISCPIERNALYNAFEKVKDADALMAPVFMIEEDNYYLFKTKKVAVRAKAIKYLPPANK